MQNFITTIRLAREACLLFLLGTTCLFIYSFTIDWMAQQSIHIALQYAAAIVATGLMAFIIDGVFSLLLDLAVRLVMGEKMDGIRPKYATHMKWLVTCGAIFMGALTGSMTWLGSGEIAHVSYSRQDTEHLTNSLDQNTATLSASIASIEKQLAGARSTQAAREIAARRKGRQLINKAIRTGNKRWQQDWKNSRSWFMGLRVAKYAKRIAYRQRILDAESKAADLLQAESQKVPTLENALLAKTTAGASAADSINTTLSSAALMIVQYDNERVAARAIGVVIGDVVCLLLAFALTFVIHMTDFPERKGKYNAAQTVSNTAFVVSQAMLWAPARLDRFVSSFERTPQADPHSVAQAPHSPTAERTPQADPHSVAQAPHSPTVEQTPPTPQADPHSVAQAPHKSRTANPTTTPQARARDRSMASEVARIDKRCRRRYDLYLRYLKESDAAAKSQNTELAARKMQQASEKLSDYKIDRDWLEMNGKSVTINSNKKVSVKDKAAQ